MPNPSQNNGANDNACIFNASRQPWVFDRKASRARERQLSEADNGGDEAALKPRLVVTNSGPATRVDQAQKTTPKPPQRAYFTRQELMTILNVYGRMVAAGEWKDYAIDFEKDRATFSIFRRASEMPVFRVEKQPKLARKQGAYSVVSQTGLILKRGHELRRVLSALDKRLRLVD